MDNFRYRPHVQVSCKREPDVDDLIAYHPTAEPPRPGGPPVAVNAVSRDRLLADLESRLHAGQGFSVATVNLDHLVKLRRSDSFRRTYAAQTHVVADGNPIVWLHRLAGRRIALIPGSDLVMPLAALAARLDLPVAFLGSTEEVLARAAERLAASCPGLRVVARIAPPRDFDPLGPEAQVFLDQLAASGARLCFIALGAPKQERLAERGLAQIPACGFVSIGAGLDFIAGHERRAPPLVRRLALEWAWRLGRNPRRMARRYFDCALILPGLALGALRARR